MTARCAWANWGGVEARQNFGNLDTEILRVAEEGIVRLEQKG